MADKKSVTRDYIRQFRSKPSICKTVTVPEGAFEYVWTDTRWAYRPDGPVLGYLLQDDPNLDEIPKPAGVGG